VEQELAGAVERQPPQRGRAMPGAAAVTARAACMRKLPVATMERDSSRAQAPRATKLWFEASSATRRPRTAGQRAGAGAPAPPAAIRTSSLVLAPRTARSRSE
jgi:hypothetical protein